MRKGDKTTLAAGCLLCAAAAWADPVPSGPMAELVVHCNEGLTSSEAACTALAERLEAVEWPSRDERLALIWSRNSLRRVDYPDAEACAATDALAAEHPDYADALYHLSFCTGDEETVALLRRAAEIEPDNYRVLRFLLTWVDTLPPEGMERAAFEMIDPGTLSAYREALYEAAGARVSWRRAFLPTDADPIAVWRELFSAARDIYVAAVRKGDGDAAEAVQARLRRDAGLDALGYGAEDSLALGCLSILYEYLGLEELCLSVVERLAAQASADGLPLPGDVLDAVERVTRGLRRAACAASTGQDPWADLVLFPGDCAGPKATESAAVARLRAVLEHHGGARSSEHLRVHAQGFLGDDERLEGLRTALRADAGNARARCDLASALAARGNSAGAAALDADPECLEFGGLGWGDIAVPPTRL